MKSQYIFPVILIMCNIGAAIVYGINKDIRMVIYWIAAAVLNTVITF